MKKNTIKICLPEYVERVYDNVASPNKMIMRVDSKHIAGVIDHPQEYYDGGIPLP